MTSNAGARELATNAIGFGSHEGDSKGKSKTALEKAFSPEFRNRLDAIVTFNALPIPVVLQVVDKFMAEVQRKLKPRRVTLIVTDDARQWLAEKGYDAKMGARPLGRLVQTEIEDRLSDELLFGNLEKGGAVRVDLKDGTLDIACEGVTPA